MQAYTAQAASGVGRLGGRSTASRRRHANLTHSRRHTIRATTLVEQQEVLSAPAAPAQGGRRGKAEGQRLEAPLNAKVLQPQVVGSSEVAPSHTMRPFAMTYVRSLFLGNRPERMRTKF